jgi:hypothetical protein
VTSLSCRYLLASDQEASSKGVGGFQAAGSPELESQLAQVLVGACRMELEALGEHRIFLKSVTYVKV